jgi:hypothetical protein
MTLPTSPPVLVTNPPPADNRDAPADKGLVCIRRVWELNPKA